MCLSQLLQVPDRASMFVFAMCSQAEFTDANTLRLTGVSSTAQFYGAGAQSALKHCPVLTCGRSICSVTA